MIGLLLRFSLRHRAAVLGAVAAALGAALWSLGRLSGDVVPDLSPVQVQVLTVVPSLAPEEGETSVTRPIELEMAGLPGLESVRSLTRFGISQVTLTFRDGTEVLGARQFVTERLAAAAERLPRGLFPRLAPPNTGLGEVFAYALLPRPGAPGAAADERGRLTALKTLQEFTVRPALRAVPGVADVNTTGGYDRALVVEPDPEKLNAAGLDLNDVADAVERNAAVGGGALVNRGGDAAVVRSLVRVQSPEVIRELTVKLGWGATPVLLREVARVRDGTRVRFGAATLNGEEAVVGTVLLLPGENGRAVARRVGARLREVQARLPADVEVRPLYDRAALVEASLRTVRNNLLAGALLVGATLLVLLGNWRAALIVTLVLPLAFVFGLAGLAHSGLSANLMSLGAIDFGLLVDGAVVLVENVVRRLGVRQRECGGRPLPGRERAEVVLDACREVAPPTVFGVLIITLVYLPVFGLEGVEGKMFAPMAAAAVGCLLAALALTLTLVPTLCALALRGRLREGDGRLLGWLKPRYLAGLGWALPRRVPIVAGAAALGLAAAFVASRRGAEFLPRLDEGSLVLEVNRPAATNLEGSVAMERATERAIRDAVPEVAGVFARLGASDITTDPQSPAQCDVYVSLRAPRHWRKVHGRTVSKEDLARLITEAATSRVPSQEITTSQPIELRLGELLEGVRADVAVKVFGPDSEQLDVLAGQVRETVARVPGAAEVAGEEVGRVPTLEIVPDREKLRRFQVVGSELDGAISTALAGREVGRIDEGQTFYPLLVRLAEELRDRPEGLSGIPFRAAERNLLLTVGQVARVRETSRLGAILREGGERRRSVLVTVRGRDTVGFVEAARQAVREGVRLPAGYRVEFGGQFENYARARARLLGWLAPLMLGGVFALVWLALRSVRLAGVVCAAVPLALVGGVFALALRGLPLTVSAAVGFVALSGLATLNGLVLVSAFAASRAGGRPAREAAVESAALRLRPVLITALVASLGLLPMAFSHAPGAELQRPLATVIVGGILSSTLLTLIVIPALLSWVSSSPRGDLRRRGREGGFGAAGRPTDLVKTS